MCTWFQTGLLIVIAVGLCRADALSDALKAGRYDDAVKLSDDLLKSDSKRPTLWTARGYALEQLGRDQESILSFETALRYAPDFLPALKGAVEVSYRSRDKRANRFVFHLIQLDPNNSVAHAMAAVLAYEAGTCPQAIEHFELSGAEIQRNEQAYSLYGVCLLKEHRASDAVVVFERLLSARPDVLDIRLHLGYAQMLVGNPAGAVKTLKPLAEQATPEADALNLLAWAEASDGEPQTAVTHLRAAIQIAPHIEQNYIDLAVLCIQNGMWQTAREIVEMSLRNVPNAARLYAIRGVIYAESGNYDEAEREFAHANEVDPNNEYGSVGLGLLYNQRNQPDSTVTAVRNSLVKNPGDPTLNYLLAEALMRKGGGDASILADARRALLHALQSKPDFGKAHALLGKLYVETGSYDAAVEELRLALRYEPDNRLALNQSVIALRRLGRQEEAAAALARLKGLVVRDFQPTANLTPVPAVRVANK